MKEMTKLLGGLGLMLALTACGGGDIEKVVQQNLEGFKKQDVDMVMETIDSQSPNYDNTRKQVTSLLKDYNLDFEIESMSVLSQPQDEAKEMEKVQKENADATGLNDALNTFINEDERNQAEERKKKEEMANSKRPLKAEVKVVQITRTKEPSSRFLSNRVIAVHTLHKYPMDEKPEWKIYKSEIRSVEVLANEG